MARRAARLAPLLLVAIASQAFGGDLAVIVHPQREVRLTVAEVAQIYLRKRRFWEDGERIVPVNRNAGSALRESFGRAVFGEAANRLLVYWNRQYFQGVLPPATLASDEAVKRFVARERLAIGYVDAARVDPSVRVVLRLRGTDGGEAPPSGGRWLHAVFATLVHRSSSLLARF